MTKEMVNNLEDFEGEFVHLLQSTSQSRMIISGELQKTGEGRYELDGPSTYLVFRIGIVESAYIRKYANGTDARFIVLKGEV